MSITQTGHHDGAGRQVDHLGVLGQQNLRVTVVDIEVQDLPGGTHQHTGGLGAARVHGVDPIGQDEGGLVGTHFEVSVSDSG